LPSIADRQAVLASGAEGDRTPDLRAASAALSRLSYGPKSNCQSICTAMGSVNAVSLVPRRGSGYSSQCSCGALRQKDSRR
jgi:hypothetical protein